MRTQRLPIFAAVLAALLPLAAGALDAPHDGSYTDNSCANCHNLFVAGASGQKDYSDACLACHQNHSNHGFPWLSTDQAVPGVRGNQHNWSGAAENPGYGANAPTSLAVQKRLVDGRLQCQTCHDPHAATPEMAPSGRWSSIAVGVAVPRNQGTGTGTLTLVNPGNTAKAFRVQLRTVTGTTGTFIVSHDFGLATPSWFNWSGTAWVPGTSTGTGAPFTAGTPVALPNSTATVTISAGGAAGDRWDFRVGFPFLRLSTVNDAACYNCHQARVMKHTTVSGNDWFLPPDGTRLFSHPVDQAPNENGGGYDRAVAAVLDANGIAQGTGDGRATNDLSFPGGLVRCTTCHRVHNADSNSLTEDPR